MPSPQGLYFRVAHSPCDSDIRSDIQSFTCRNTISFDKIDEHSCRFGSANIHADPARCHEKMVDIQKPELEGFTRLVLPFKGFVEPDHSPRSASRDLRHS